MHVFVQPDRSHLTKVNCKCKKHSDSSQEFSEAYFIYILNVLIDNILAGCVFHRQSQFLCASTVLQFRQFVPLFVRRRHQEKKAIEPSPIL